MKSVPDTSTCVLLTRKRPRPRAVVVDVKTVVVVRRVRAQARSSWIESWLTLHVDNRGSFGYGALGGHLRVNLVQNKKQVQNITK